MTPTSVLSSIQERHNEMLGLLCPAMQLVLLRSALRRSKARLHRQHRDMCPPFSLFPLTQHPLSIVLIILSRGLGYG